MDTLDRTRLVSRLQELLIRLRAEGRTTGDLADIMGISEGSVQNAISGHRQLNVGPYLVLSHYTALRNGDLRAGRIAVPEEFEVIPARGGEARGMVTDKVLRGIEALAQAQRSGQAGDGEGVRSASDELEQVAADLAAEAKRLIGEGP